MKKPYHFVEVTDFVECELPDGSKVRLPVVMGIFKHADTEMLHDLLKKPAAAKKYTIESLRVAPWPVLREFPRSWLTEHLDQADIRPSRKAAVLFMLTPQTVGQFFKLPV